MQRASVGNELEELDHFEEEEAAKDLHEALAAKEVLFPTLPQKPLLRGMALYSVIPCPCVCFTFFLFCICTIPSQLQGRRRSTPPMPADIANFPCTALPPSSNAVSVYIRRCPILC